MTQAEDDANLWKRIRETYPPDSETYDWIIVIPLAKAAERKDWTLIRQTAARIVRAVEDEAVIESINGVRARVPLTWVRARCTCPWSMSLSGCKCGAMKRDADMSFLLDMRLPED